MIIFAGIAEFLTDARFDANLIACYGVIVVLVLLALSLRRMLARDRPASTGMQWLDTLGDEATAHARKLLWWSSVAAVILLQYGVKQLTLAFREVDRGVLTARVQNGGTPLPASHDGQRCLDGAGRDLAVIRSQVH